MEVSLDWDSRTRRTHARTHMIETEARMTKRLSDSWMGIVGGFCRMEGMGVGIEDGWWRDGKQSVHLGSIECIVNGNDESCSSRRRFGLSRFIEFLCIEAISKL